MPENIDRITGLIDTVGPDFTTALCLLGMGGSSLAPEVFQEASGKPVRAGSPFLEIVAYDSTAPDLLLERAGNLDPARTLFIVATKSGGGVPSIRQGHGGQKQRHYR